MQRHPLFTFFTSISSRRDYHADFQAIYRALKAKDKTTIHKLLEQGALIDGHEYARAEIGTFLSPAGICAVGDKDDLVEFSLQFNPDKNLIAAGYAMGGFTDKSNKMRLLYHLDDNFLAFAAATCRQTNYVNLLILCGVDINCAMRGYAYGGHWRQVEWYLQRFKIIPEEVKLTICSAVLEKMLVGCSIQDVPQAILLSALTNMAKYGIDDLIVAQLKETQDRNSDYRIDVDAVAREAREVVVAAAPKM